jgi:deoxyribonuclease V
MAFPYGGEGAFCFSGVVFSSWSVGVIRLQHSHPWRVSPKEAIQIQQQLRGLVRIGDEFGTLRRVAGVDVGFEQNNTITRAAVAVLDFSSLELLEYSIGRLPTSFPYVPGLLSFREVPAVLAALEKLSTLPDMLLCDGQGIAHPRRLGIASHLGVLLDLPTIGVAKSRLIGRHEEPGEEKGSWQPLYEGEELLGCALRTRRRIKPLYISPGHRVGFATARELVLACTTRYRLPETTRWAHRLASGVEPDWA